MAENPPLILTLKLDEPAFAFFNTLRIEYFPPEINYLQAHLTLFHHLPNVSAVTDLLNTVAENQPVIGLEVTNPMKLGRGVAYALKSEELLQLHHRLQKQWQEWLTPQDQQRLRPHVTVQNKVAPEKVNALYVQLIASFKPFTAAGMGLSLWEYQGGPWLKLQDYPFAPRSIKTNI
jgi:hypothetical protein